MTPFLAAALPLLAAGLATAGTVCLEAEAARDVQAPMAIAKADPARDGRDPMSGDACLVVPEGAGKPPKVGGSAVLDFEVAEAGTYVLWTRAWWTDRCGNSVSVAVDDGKPCIVEDSTYKSWHWLKLKAVTFNLSAGKHRLKLLNREDGVRLDQFLLTTDAGFVPVGIEKAATPTPAAP